MSYKQEHPIQNILSKLKKTDVISKSAPASDFDMGLVAAQRGDFATALTASAIRSCSDIIISVHAISFVP